MNEITNVELQIRIFLIFISIGGIIGLLFDFFKSIRKSFKTPDIITYVEDFFFWILAGVILIYSIIIFNEGQIRGYVFFGIFIGSLLYSLTISKLSVIIFTSVIKILKIIFNTSIKILVFPIIFFKKPIIVISLNLKKILTNFKERNIKKLNKSKKGNAINL